MPLHPSGEHNGARCSLGVADKSQMGRMARGDEEVTIAAAENRH
jgi:hypothetical protein